MDARLWLLLGLGVGDALMGWPVGHPELAKQQPVVAFAAPPAAGFKRGQTQRADKTDIGLRGVPVIGHGSGAIANSAPGGELGQAARLERDVREARELNNRARRVVRERVSASGVLRPRRETI